MIGAVKSQPGGGTLATNPKTLHSDVTQLLTEWRGGDSSAGDKLLPLVYDELYRAAARAMSREAAGHTLQPTALVNEAYLRLVDQSRAAWQNRAQFYGVAAQVMRRVLVDHARARQSEKRGGGVHPITLDDLRDPAEEATPLDVLALNDALEKLASFDPDQAKVVELRYFSGLNIDETAEALGISPATVKREWSVARAWLRRELTTT